MNGILTFHWADDCGAMLQAFGLKRCIETLGGNAVIIPYAPYKLTARYWWLPFSARYADGRLFYRPNPMVWLAHIRGTAYYRRRRAMRRFRREYLTKAAPVRRASALKLSGFSRVFVGSDQVWNPDITVGVDDAYLGNIPKPEDCRLISYAASLGGHRFTEDELKRFVPAVKANFSAVSLREPSDLPYITELIGDGAEAVLDPVFLPDPSDFARAAASVPETRYILVYRTEYDQSLADYVQKLSKEKGLGVILLSPPLKKERDMGWRIPARGVGPSEFVGYIKNADFVVTNSFHATAFSLLLHKQFVTFRHSTRNGRLSDLLSLAGLEGRMTDGSIPPDISAPIDWDSADKLLDAERQRSRDFISRQLGT